jgi:hypothetical protein
LTDTTTKIVVPVASDCLFPAISEALNSDFAGDSEVEFRFAQFFPG